jgi:NAD(P)-dependent dehydrogenase (short-subunit alcohol dehydrogenase family)
MNRKIALVTGGSRGLGKEMAKSLATRGLDVIITYNTEKEAAEQVATAVELAGGKCGILQLNMANLSELNNFVSDLKTLLSQKWNTTCMDYLINNAGIGATVPMAQVSEELFDNMLNIHYKGVYFLTQKLLPMMNDNGGVIFISSGTTRFCVPGYSV